MNGESRGQGAEDPHRATGDVAGEGLSRSLDRWVAAALITREQAVAIRAFEAERGEVAAPRRVPLITEALGYLGAALALAAGIVALVQVWDDLSVGARLGILGAATAALWIGGFVIRGTEEPAIRRLGGVLWVLAVGASTAFAGVLGAETLELEAENVALLAGAVSTTFGGLLYVARRQALQQIVLFAGLVTLLVSIGVRIAEPTRGGGPPGGLAPAIWILGVVWLILAWTGVVPPANLSFALGSAAALVAPSLRSEPLQDLAVAVALLTAAALVAASVPLRRTVLLGFGSVGLFAHLVYTIGLYFGDTLGTPLVLLVSGVILVVMALATARLRRFTAPAGPETQPRG